MIHVIVLVPSSLWSANQPALRLFPHLLSPPSELHILQFTIFYSISLPLWQQVSCINHGVPSCVISETAYFPYPSIIKVVSPKKEILFHSHKVIVVTKTFSTKAWLGGFVKLFYLPVFCMLEKEYFMKQFNIFHNLSGIIV